MTGLYIGAILLCLLASAFFSASEMSLSSCNKVRLERMEEEGNKRAGKAVRVVERFDDALSAILVGNNLVNIAASSLGSLLAIRLLSEKSAWAVTAVITVAVIIFGETIPKITAQKNATRFSLVIAGPIRALSIILRPVTSLTVAAVNALTGRMRGEEIDEEEEAEEAVEELHTIVETAEDEDVFDEDESELISAAIDFSDTSASEAMTSRVDLVAIDIDDDWEEILETINDSPYSRLPVYEDSIDNIVGILSVNRFLKALADSPAVNIRNLLMEPCFVYKTMKLPSVLKTLKESQQHLAIVTDEYGGTDGIVSMEDVLERLVGDIWDETDTVEDEVTEQAEGVFEVDGDMPISDFLELLELDEDDFDYESETVGGWCIEMLGDFPEEGERFEYEGYEIVVMEADERRVRKVKAGPAGQETADSF